MTETATPIDPAAEVARATGAAMPPTTEVGHPGNIAPTYGTRGLEGDYYVEGSDDNPEWIFPASARIVDKMRKEDGQVGSVLRAIYYPILNAERTLAGVRPANLEEVPEGVDPANMVRPEVARFVANELGLDLDANAGARRRRRREGIVFADHLREALLALPFGFMPFEVTYHVAPATPGQEDPERERALGTNLYAHLRRLSARMPSTLSDVLTDAEGGLAAILQQAPPGLFAPGWQHNTDTMVTGEKRIDVSRLVMYCHDREGAEWTGTSILRTAYKHWLLKDHLIRLGGQAAERNSMGVPVITHDENTTHAEASKVGRDFRAGANSHIVLKPGQTVELIGVTGTTVDTVPLVKYHDESIGRSMLAMFLNLGHDNGARALGSTFVDYWLLAINSVLRMVEEVVTEHIIRDLVELNYGPDEPYPSLKFTDLTAEATPTAESLKALADAGLITADRETENNIRRRYRLPAKPADAPVAPVAEQQPDELAQGGTLLARVSHLAELAVALEQGHR